MFRQDIQGLRALAVLSVVIFHAFPLLLTGGYVGVDIFFVISGFLITGIIMRKIEGDRFSISEFYRQRIKRIIPALLVMLAACYGAGYLWLAPLEFKDLNRSIFSTAIFLSNIDFWKTTGYFDSAAELKPLLHTWSLAVEMQFYIFYPFLLYFIMKYAPNHVNKILLGLLLASLAISELTLHFNPSAAYFFLPARAYELLAGGLLVRGSSHIALKQNQSNILSLFGIGLIAASACLYTPGTAFPGIAGFIPCLGAAFIIFSGSRQTSVAGKILSAKPLVFIGDISYSLYLWHWPALVFLRHLYGVELTWQQSLCGILFAVIASIFSFYYIEKPFLREKYQTFPFFRAATAAVGILACVSLGTYALKGLPERYSEAARIQFKAAEDFNPRRQACHNHAAKPLPYEEYCLYGKAGTMPDTVVWSDSHGTELVAALGNNAERAGRSIKQITASACPPSLGFTLSNRPECASTNRQVLASLLQDKSINTIILAANAERYQQDQGFGLFKQGYEKVVHDLTTNGKQVILMLQIPNMTNNPPVSAGFAIERGEKPDEMGLPRNRYDAQAHAWNNFVKTLSQKYNAEFYDPTVALCDSRVCHFYKTGLNTLYFNNDHLNITGAKFMAQKLGEKLYGPDEIIVN